MISYICNASPLLDKSIDELHADGRTDVESVEVTPWRESTFERLFDCREEFCRSDHWGVDLRDEPLSMSTKCGIKALAQFIRK